MTAGGIVTELGPRVLVHLGFPLLPRVLLSSPWCQDSMKVSETEQLQPCVREPGLAGRESNLLAGGAVRVVPFLLGPCANTWLCHLLNRKVSLKLALM